MGAVAPFVVIEQVLIDKEKWLDFWEYFEAKALIAGVELLYTTSSWHHQPCWHVMPSGWRPTGIHHQHQSQSSPKKPHAGR